MEPRFLPASDASVLIVVDEVLGERASARVHACLRALQREPPGWLRDLHPAYTSLLVELDLAAITHEDATAWLRARAGTLDDAAADKARLVEVPVRYGGEEGPDLAALAAHAGLTVEEVVSRHSQASYTVAFLGFQPGFAYLLGLPESLHMPRLASPRPLVPAGSVAIGGAQAGVYPREGPGGWRLLGRTTRVLSEDWVQPGDRVRFVVERGAP